MVRFLRVTMLWILLLPPAVYTLGAASNQLVLIANHDKFPVMLNQLKTEQAAGPYGMLDEEHVVMSSETHLNLLADVFDFKGSIESIGDLLLDFGSWLWTFCPFVWGVLVVQRLGDPAPTKP